MLKTSGKRVHTVGIRQRKNSVHLSTDIVQSLLVQHASSAKTRFILHFIPFFPQQLSPLKIAISPLFEHYFYPVSTALTISTTKEEFERKVII